MNHDELYNEATTYITSLIYQLGDSYDMQYNIGVDSKALANAIDALIYVNDQLGEQRIASADHEKKQLEMNSSEGDK